MITNNPNSRNARVLQTLITSPLDLAFFIEHAEVPHLDQFFQGQILEAMLFGLFDELGVMPWTLAPTTSSMSNLNPADCSDLM